jgi:endonuclease/exonuclease/phosphatase (EEP) superfamily protein YafD
MYWNDYGPTIKPSHSKNHGRQIDHIFYDNELINTIKITKGGDCSSDHSLISA